jgi:polyphosphate kinase 2
MVYQPGIYGFWMMNKKARNPRSKERSLLEDEVLEESPISETSAHLIGLDELEETMAERYAEDDGEAFHTRRNGQTLVHRDGYQLTPDDLERVNTNRGLYELLRSKNIRLKEVFDTLRYVDELVQLQVELVKLQRWVNDKGKRIAILFEGRDAAGKGGTIRRFTEHLNPRLMRVVALPKPTEEERGQWYFQRYSKQLPNQGEIVFFDRSWYNRAVVEPVNHFCTEVEYERFMQQVPEYEHMLYEDGITIIKFWFSISKGEQQVRFNSRRANPLKQWKLSAIDERAQEFWDDYTHHKEMMFSKTHTSFSPWIIVKANDKKQARLESIRYVLNTIDYPGKEEATTRVAPDPDVVGRFHRNVVRLD